MSEYIEWSALGNVLLFGILVGAGLPALFALGVRTVAGPSARDAEGNVPTGRKVLGGICFGITLVAVLGAVAYIAAGGH
ncbi:hypothetical protein [Demequina mangrovi]|uniref:Uncharacterized protein n=1 Tax=Demequina mangrovi TaxID=1043493 RepID=A0A1H7AIQ5_9MICO|nr:hypothetical protein [Demequina mangrovi]SEJ65523.1 hypothetical protein SAMN05421637_2555 [Demequina mangrovi]